MRPEPRPGFAPDLSVGALNAQLRQASAEEALHAAFALHGDRVALVSSFGAESAVLLHMVAELRPETPVLLVDTEMLFPQTLAYQQDLTAYLGLTDVRRIAQSREDLKARDPYGALHLTDPDTCCAMRKVEPLQGALVGFDASISGRKRFQAGTRTAMDIFETDDEGRMKVNPLADWKTVDVALYMDRHELPRHPLVAEGYPSIGCMPCTSTVEDGEDPRAGRWRGTEKVECGIHAVDGAWTRSGS